MLVFSSSGSHVRAAVLDVGSFLDRAPLDSQGFVLDANMYAIQTRSPTEAHYLAALLNSDVVDEAIKSGQTRGAWGPRHVHRRPFEVTGIVEFDSSDEIHRRLAELSHHAHEALGDTRPMQKRRQAQLEPVEAQFAEINTLAAALLDIESGKR